MPGRALRGRGGLWTSYTSTARFRPRSLGFPVGSDAPRPKGSRGGAPQRYASTHPKTTQTHNLLGFRVFQGNPGRAGIFSTKTNKRIEEFNRFQGFMLTPTLVRPRFCFSTWPRLKPGIDHPGFTRGVNLFARGLPPWHEKASKTRPGNATCPQLSYEGRRQNHCE